MESGQVTISRAKHKLSFPAKFQLIAAMNPCPCGYLGDPERQCRCTPDQIQRYQGRVSGPLLDRIDLHAYVPRISPGLLLKKNAAGENSETVRDRVKRCREIQVSRQHCVNAHLGTQELLDICGLDHRATQMLEKAAEKMHLSGRALHRSLRVARTIADMACLKRVSAPEFSEALGYRKH
jgi:magnesium chelatase family protein